MTATIENDEARAAALEILGPDAAEMTLAEVIRDLQADRESLQRELLEAREMLRETIAEDL